MAKMTYRTRLVVDLPNYRLAQSRSTLELSLVKVIDLHQTKFKCWHEPICNYSFQYFRL